MSESVLNSGQWIDIRERQPTRSDGCHMWSGHEDEYADDRRTPYILCWCSGGGGFATVSFWNCDKRGVTHWMPLRRPEPPPLREVWIPVKAFPNQVVNAYTSRRDIYPGHDIGPVLKFREVRDESGPAGFHPNQ